MSISPVKAHTPIPPPYGPRLLGSSSSMICMARTLGAPLTVPAGSAALSVSHAERPFLSAPSTVLLMCITWLYRSTSMSLSTTTLPISATRPTSLRPRSTSMTCSARSFSSARSSDSSAASSSSVLPRGRVPASGRFTTHPSLSTRHRISGLDATQIAPRACRYTMYGLGFTTRRLRYTSKGSANDRRSNLWLSTTWKMSPAWMYSFALATASRKPPLVMLLRRGLGVKSAVRSVTVPAASGGDDSARRRPTTCASRDAPCAYAARTSSPWLRPSSSSTQCTTYTVLVALSKTTASLYSPRWMSGRPRSSPGAEPNGSLDR
mmetsp:Transcript_10236/g.35613  ORF Transcript_10236/g.35613 Transcript_10236/m.35613 type:complete len:321 (+) Transcript_10236:328-1290(+)